MQVLNTGTTYRIYDESMKAFDQLPPAVYKINFNPMQGYSLIKTDDIVITEKIYGNHTEKVEKVFKSFKLFPRNLGVILSGNKGIGKSLFAKLLSIKSVENGYPIILCDHPYSGIADFLGSIQQEIVVLFDEFDKTFAGGGKDEDDAQADMLTLFDGMYMGKKMFIITCNSINKLNDYLINRPGRFHYHFRFDYPSEIEVEEYLKDNVVEEYWSEIDAVVDFSKKVDLNFDCLRAIAFELNLGTTFTEVVKDLNIVNLEGAHYSLTLYFKNGISYTYKRYYMNVFSGDSETVWLGNKAYPNVRITFNPSANTYDYDKGGMVVKSSDIDIDFWETDDYDEWNEEKVADYKKKQEELEKCGVDFMLMKREYKNDNIHYVL